MAKITEERSEIKPGVPHSRPSASGNSGPQSLPDKGIPAARSSPSASKDSASQRQLETRNSKLETAPTHQLETGNLKLETAPAGNSKLETIPRDPDNEASPIPGLLNRHLNYLKFAGMPVPESQRKRFHIPQAYVSSMSARKVEFEINSALRRRNKPR
jgi:hypothetical protein